MEFIADRPIYKQIMDFCMAQIAHGTWATDGRVPSVKELSAGMAVNTRTVLKAYEELENGGIIYQKRGLGFFVANDACDRILDIQRNEFLQSDLPTFAQKVKLLNFPIEEIINYLKSNK